VVDVAALRRDRWLWAAVAVGVLVRCAPLWIWDWSAPVFVRDEWIYKGVAEAILAGEGLQPAPKGWLPAPGYPYLLAGCHALFGSFQAVKWVQVLMAAVSTVLVYDIARRVYDQRSARIAGWLYALHPSLVFFVGTLWTEISYSTLLLAVSHGVLWCRDRSGWTAVWPGVLLGVTVVFRGVATYMAPIFVLAVLWGGWRARRSHGLAFVCGAMLTVLPYSVHASVRWGGPMVSDATLGHVMQLGNDDFDPVTFDYAVGQLTGEVFRKTLSRGRRDCPSVGGPLAHDRCEIQRSVAWIKAHPTTFLARIPQRLAQLFNPHSFLTRHVRWGYWPGLVEPVKTLLVTASMLFTVFVMAGGVFSAWGRARGPYGIITVGVTVYTTAVIAVLYGLTRFRLPLEPLWMVVLAAALADPKSTWATLREARWRWIGALSSSGVVLWLMSWYWRTGYPGLW